MPVPSRRTAPMSPPGIRSATSSSGNLPRASRSPRWKHRSCTPGTRASDGFLMFFDLQEKKAVREEKVAMHVHDFTFNDALDTIYAVGHGKIVILEMKA